MKLIDADKARVELYESDQITFKGLEILCSQPEVMKWTAVKERYPTEEKDYLCQIGDNTYGYWRDILTYSNNLYDVDKYDFKERKGAKGFFFFDTEFGFLECGDVIAWMELPEPYKEEE